MIQENAGIAVAIRAIAELPVLLLAIFCRYMGENVSIFSLDPLNFTFSVWTKDRGPKWPHTLLVRNIFRTSGDGVHISFVSEESFFDGEITKYALFNDRTILAYFDCGHGSRCIKIGDQLTMEMYLTV